MKLLRSRWRLLFPCTAYCVAANTYALARDLGRHRQWHIIHGYAVSSAILHTAMAWTLPYSMPALMLAATANLLIETRDLV
jgi:hypothetical protein